ncbi:MULTISPECIES: hypothetical protein [unclassified Brucella]|uniref:hypothetical protein n=1 Tax=unclassified Brucella TaxID=2632610 RepID=UPI0012ADBC71|nr:MULTISPECIES: hypothetical protein [unclassified Brucella]MRN79354.1 hypothetical protein [Brucella sp. 10RB9210]
MANNNTRYAACSLIGIAIGFSVASFVVRFVSLETPIYMWDWGAYFRLYQKFMPLVSNGGDWETWLVQSIINDDYNLSTLPFLYPFYVFFGASRIGYILAVVFTYMLPAIGLAYIISRSSIIKTVEFRLPLIISTFSIVFFSHSLWSATLRGYPDIAGLIPLGLATLLFTTWLQRGGRNAVLYGLLYGLLVWLAFMFRRWYAFSCVGIGVATFLILCLEIYSAKLNRAEILKSSIIFVISSATVTISILYFLQFDIAIRSINTPHGKMFSAYQRPFLVQAHQLILTVGYPLFFAFIAGVALALKNKNKTILFTSICSISTYLIFSRTQAPGYQHILPIIFWSLPTMAYSVSILLSWVWLRTSYAIAFALLIYCAINFFSVFMPTVKKHVAPISILFSASETAPLVMPGYKNFQAMLNDLKETIRNDDKVGIFASNETLSDALVEAADYSFRDHIAWVAQIDQRDGFWLDGIMARYALTTNKTLYHVNPDGQRVIGLPSELLRGAKGFGANYIKIREYPLQNGIVAFLYERKVPYAPREAEELTKEFQEFYPEWRWDGYRFILTEVGQKLKREKEEGG